jgi:aminoglycoside 6'-N-acetyltransferase
MIDGEVVRLRPAEVTDGPRFTEVLQTPEVARGWSDSHDESGGVSEQVRELLAPAPGTSTFAILAKGEPGEPVAGFVQCSEEPDPQYRHAGIDIAVHPDWHGRGIGTDAVRTLARYLVTERGHHRLVIDPAAANEIAIRSYRKVGFRPVGIMRRYERGADGTFHDGLLMDLLAEELGL